METLTVYFNELQFDKLQRLAIQEGRLDVLTSFVANLVEQACDELLDEDDFEEADLEEADLEETDLEESAA